MDVQRRHLNIEVCVVRLYRYFVRRALKAYTKALRQMFVAQAVLGAFISYCEFVDVY